jgi:hypothetical protein
MQSRLSQLEVELLRKLRNGEAVTISSLHRVRLEHAGVIREGANGIVLTAEGLRVAVEGVPSGEAMLDDTGPRTRLNSRGRKLPFQRRSVF